MKNDAFSMTLLFDYYGELLTEKQKTYFDLYYNQDFSLAEIAEEEGISRQGVHDMLIRTEAALRKFEEKTGIVARATERMAALETIRQAAEKVKVLDSQLADTILTACDTMKE